MTDRPRLVPRVMMITPPRAVWDEAFRRTLTASLDGGVDAVLVRLPTATSREVFEFAGAARPLVEASGARLFIHDRLDVALALGVDGLHLARRSVPVEAARRLMPGATIGYSAHGVEETGLAHAAGADFAMVSPVFATSSKPGVIPLGVDAARRLSASVSLPTLWLGGVSAGRLEEAGACPGDPPHGVAAIDAFVDADSAADEARRMRAWLGA